jgi:hypothetical protein
MLVTQWWCTVVYQHHYCCDKLTVAYQAVFLRQLLRNVQSASFIGHQNTATLTHINPASTVIWRDNCGTQFSGESYAVCVCVHIWLFPVVYCWYHIDAVHSLYASVSWALQLQPVILCAMSGWVMNQRCRCIRTVSLIQMLYNFPCTDVRMLFLFILRFIIVFVINLWLSQFLILMMGDVTPTVTSLSTFLLRLRSSS